MKRIRNNAPKKLALTLIIVFCVIISICVKCHCLLQNEDELNWDGSGHRGNPPLPPPPPPGEFVLKISKWQDIDLSFQFSPHSKHITECYKTTPTVLVICFCSSSKTLLLLFKYKMLINIMFYFNIVS